MTGCVVLFLLSGLTLFSCVTEVQPQDVTKEVSCHVLSWATLRQSIGRFTVSDIDPHLCTNVVYAYATMNDANDVVPMNERDIPVYPQLVSLKQLKPSLKLHIAVGGWEEGSVKYSVMARDERRRNTFVSSAVEFVKSNGFDGLILDWKDPATRDGIPEDKQNLVILAEELHRALDRAGKTFSLAVSARKYQIDVGYDLVQLSPFVERFYVVTYEYHGFWDGKTGLNSPVHARANENGEQSELNVEYSLQYILSKGVSPSKILMGIPFFGRSYLLTSSDFGVGAPAESTSFRGPYTQEVGLIAYNEVCNMLDYKWRRMRHHQHGGNPYTRLNNQWIGYEDVISVAYKVRLAERLKLGGVFLWSIDYDDFKGVCNEGRYPLLQQVNKIILDSSPTPTVVCFLAGWSVWRLGADKFIVEDVDPTLCSNVVMAYVGLDETTNAVKVIDEVYSFGAFGELRDLRLRTPGLLVGLVVGGYSQGTAKFSRMASSDEGRQSFVTSVVNLLRDHEMDELVLDWHSPGSSDGSPQDKENYVKLVSELRQAFAPHGWKVSVMVPHEEYYREVGFDLRAMSESVDQFHLTAYDYNGPWNGVTGHNAPLYARSTDRGVAAHRNVNYTVEHMLIAGVAPENIILGIPLHGRTFTLLNASRSSVGDQCHRKGFKGPNSREEGLATYHEVCLWQAEDEPIWTNIWDEEQKVPYLVNGHHWVSYDNRRSVGMKAQLTKTHKLGGVHVWSIDCDDFSGGCGRGKYPLLTEINRVLTGELERPAVPVTPTVVISEEVPPSDTSNSEGCSVAVGRDVTIVVVSCGSIATQIVNNFERRYPVCEEDSMVPPLTVISANCWGAANILLRCFSDGQWRPFNGGSMTIGSGDRERMTELCQPRHINSQICGRRPPYVAMRPTLDLFRFFSPDRFFNRWPWVVGLKYGERYGCSGTLLSPSHVLTAGHCVLRSEDSMTTMDVRDLKVQIKRGGSIHDVRVSQLHLHPSYMNGARPGNDLAIIVLENPLKFNKDLYPACIHLEEGFVSGEALTFNRSSKEFKYNLLLHRISPSCVELNECFQHLSLRDTQFCGVERSSTKFLAEGSSGGPLLQDISSDNINEKVWAVTGVVSTNVKRSQCPVPHTVFTAPHQYEDWLFHATS